MSHLRLQNGPQTLKAFQQAPKGSLDWPGPLAAQRISTLSAADAKAVR